MEYYLIVNSVSSLLEDEFSLQIKALDFLHEEIQIEESFYLRMIDKKLILFADEIKLISGELVDKFEDRKLGLMVTSFGLDISGTKRIVNARLTDFS
jgi:hypothetical protein